MFILNHILRVPCRFKCIIVVDCCRKNEEVVVAVVVCKNRTSEALVMIKSAIVFRGRSDLRIVVVAEKNIQQEFDETVRYC